MLASAVLLALLSLEVNDYFAAHVTSGELPPWLDAADARQMTLSVLWAGYGLGLIAAGILRRYSRARQMGILLLAGTVLKVFVLDLGFLSGTYRVLSFLALGSILVSVSYLYQRHRDLLPGA